MFNRSDYCVRPFAISPQKCSACEGSYNVLPSDWTRSTGATVSTIWLLEQTWSIAISHHYRAWQHHNFRDTHTGNKTYIRPQLDDKSRTYSFCGGCFSHCLRVSFIQSLARLLQLCLNMNSSAHNRIFSLDRKCVKDAIETSEPCLLFTSTRLFFC